MKLRVLLVDDEKLVRKCLEALFPWDEFDMEVVGGAATGEEALRWLAGNEADIIFVDLSMPVMDGFELLKTINLEYPAMVKIVLSCHAEIKYIQRTIEEGIAGYILKTDFEMEDIRKLMSRARELAIRNHDRPLSRGLLTGCTQKEYTSLMRPGVQVTWLEDRLALLETEGKPASLLPQGQSGMLVNLTEEQLHLFSLEPDQARAVVSRQLFYEAKEGVRIYRLSTLPRLSAEVAQELQRQLIEGEWLLSADACKALQAQLVALYYPADEILRGLSLLKEELDCALQSPTLEKAWQALETSSLVQWQVVQQLMETMRQAVAERMQKSGLYAESVLVLLRALRIIHDPKKLFGKANEVVSMVGFSCSHFSRCFSQFMGMSYRDYTREMRLRWIQRKIQQEGMSIAEIAASLDYVNAEYFCRIYNIKLTDNKIGGK